ncbi:hypothetical protein MPH_03106 [Macrophomina phaseolina MS6]|uniref:Uncharacterized protein n=1 Tax=Macrophomina phaseolina (strain MS6) TaxID=1126212 RepID=K2SSF3_MACPH|nr:hypothetical protein MPH_03106 [Macrophomina phaseolina MS6]
MGSSNARVEHSQGSKNFVLLQYPIGYGAARLALLEIPTHGPVPTTLHIPSRNTRLNVYVGMASRTPTSSQLLRLHMHTGGLAVSLASRWCRLGQSDMPPCFKPQIPCNGNPQDTSAFPPLQKGRRHQRDWAGASVGRHLQESGMRSTKPKLSVLCAYKI